MRAFKLITFAVAVFGSVHAEEMEIIDHDAPVDLLPDPVMPENPYGDLTLDDIVRTGTLDGVNPP